MSEWIKCLNEKPHQGQKVLVAVNAKSVMAGEYWEHEPGVHDSDTGFVDLDCNDLFPVTHWMPLPSPPDDSQ